VPAPEYSRWHAHGVVSWVVEESDGHFLIGIYTEAVQSITAPIQYRSGDGRQRRPVSPRADARRLRAVAGRGEDDATDRPPECSTPDRRTQTGCGTITLSNRVNHGPKGRQLYVGTRYACACSHLPHLRFRPGLPSNRHRRCATARTLGLSRMPHVRSVRVSSSHAPAPVNHCQRVTVADAVEMSGVQHTDPPRIDCRWRRNAAAWTRLSLLDLPPRSRARRWRHAHDRRAALR
jgi:hypothetical protein